MPVAMSTMTVPMAGSMPGQMPGQQDFLDVDKLRPPRKNKPRGGSKPKTLVLDPEDLTRRLEVVLMEREAYMEKKRRSRANIDRASRHHPVSEHSKSRRGREAPPDNAPYPVQDPNPVRASAARRSAHASHYLSMVNMDPPEPPGKEYKPGYHNVPRTAASQHSATTTSDHSDRHQASHKLSKEAMRFHMGGNVIPRKPVAGGPTRDMMQDMARQRSQREGVYHRNQFQNPAAMDNANIGMTERQNQPGNRHTFNAFARDSMAGDDLAPHRISMSSMKGQYRGEPDFGESPGGIAPLPEHDENIAPTPRRLEGRADWTQSDDQLDRAPNQLRKPRSRWTVRDRLSMHRSSKSDKDMMKDGGGLSHQRSKSGFFSLFRRNS